ncbi:MAG: triose-phosphate isomerase [Calditrichaeota bacterium]|nr:triose-phosphate isomerase [Calditrichota bacterium]MCB0293935.1 triose-phosphate isomerase [Calditrichota bacterium]MCB0305601.1 triose-phosphate isomerase [Calditrichota bacterium]MCB0315119.1 triose-phosphate isomerase [Calditrichota bacterium]
MRQKIIAGNWKMFKTIPEALRLVKSLETKLEKKPPAKSRVLVFPPFTAISAVSEALKNSKIGVGAQNIAWEAEGAYTGEISATMVKNAGAKHVIIGHSERRGYFKEDPHMLNKKIKLALQHKLKVVYCIGETLEEREQNLTRDIILNQIEWDLKDLTPNDLKQVVLAYEPVWAIGTGRTATPEQAQEIHAFLRDPLDALYGEGVGKSMSILYGGSVKPENALGLLSQPDIDGALVGGACLDAGSFYKIIEASEKAAK